ncbi:MAG TPA: hypothetical protein VN457_06785, partial [Chlamydiales bacterium]|nr:hypothetical protein [Chlamydiales bacterium]
MQIIEEIQSSCEAEFHQPLLDYLHAKQLGITAVPYIPKWDIGPLHQLCQLSLLWQKAGFERQAGELAHF